MVNIILNPLFQSKFFFHLIFNIISLINVFEIIYHHCYNDWINFNCYFYNLTNC